MEPLWTTGNYSFVKSPCPTLCLLGTVAFLSGSWRWSHPAPPFQPSAIGLLPKFRSIHGLSFISLVQPQNLRVFSIFQLSKFQTQHVASSFLTPTNTLCRWVFDLAPASMVMLHTDIRACDNGTVRGFYGFNAAETSARCLHGHVLKHVSTSRSSMHKLQRGVFISTTTCQGPWEHQCRPYTRGLESKSILHHRKFTLSL